MASPFIIPSQGFGEALASSTSSITFSNGYSVIQTGDLIYVGIAVDGPLSVTGISGSGFPALTKRASGQFLTDGSCTASTWYAVATSPGTGFSLTATFGGTFDDCALAWAIVRGAVAGAPFDPYVALPYSKAGASPAACAITYATKNPDDLLLFLAFGENGLYVDPALFGQQVTPSPPWSFMAGAGNSGGSGFCGAVNYQNTVSSVQTGQTVGSFVSFATASVFIVDAFTADAPVVLPGIPIDEACGPSTNTSITPQWAPNPSGSAPTSYTLQWRPPGGGAFTVISGITSTSQQITGLAAGTTYEWQVEAVNSNGVSGFSASFFCLTPPLYPPTSPPLPAQTAAALAKGILVVGDYQNGNLYLLDLDQPTDNGTQRKWLRTWRAVQKASVKPMRFPALVITMETGGQVPDGTNPQVQLRYSDDGGHTWSNTIFEAAGKTGQTAFQVKFRRLGSTRAGQGLDRILELSSTDSFKVAIVGADWDEVPQG